VLLQGDKLGQKCLCDKPILISSSLRHILY